MDRRQLTTTLFISIKSLDKNESRLYAETNKNLMKVLCPILYLNCLNAYVFLVNIVFFIEFGMFFWQKIFFTLLKLKEGQKRKAGVISFDTFKNKLVYWYKSKFLLLIMLGTLEKDFFK